MSPGIELDDVTQGYPGRQVLRNFSLKLDRGIVGVLGPNGAGKTTLLNTMATVCLPLQGTVSVNGTTIRHQRDARTARRNIGYLPQNFGYFATSQSMTSYATWRGLGKFPGDIFVI